MALCFLHIPPSTLSLSESMMTRIIVLVGLRTPRISK
jgi:hypothetical protein